MLKVLQLHNKNDIKVKQVCCPCCRTGRLCDIPVELKVSTSKLTINKIVSLEPSVILKCHKCGQKSVVQFLYQ